MDHSSAPLLLTSVSPHIPLFHPYMASPPPPPPTRSSLPRRSKLRQPPSLDTITANTATTSTFDSTVYQQQQQQQQSASSPSFRGRQPMTVSIPPRKRSRHGRLPSGDLSPTSLNQSRSPPSSDSGDEHDEEVPSPGGGVKRKRTRTLTTPVQAHALYALLAEVRSSGILTLQTVDKFDRRAFLRLSSAKLLGHPSD